jgi:beta-phosphoglucomutase-like phosphatase (HAD superfamily)
MNTSSEEIKDIDLKITSKTVLFFDMDGTLIDTDFANYLSYKKAIINVTNSKQNLTYNPGKRFTRSVLKHAVPYLTENQYELIIKEKEKYYIDFLHEAKLNMAIIDLLLKYSKTNKTVLVTNCRKDRAMITLKHFKLLNHFSSIICRASEPTEQIVNKYQNAISTLGISSSLVIAFENEEMEIQDAKKAGILKIIKIQTT